MRRSFILRSDTVQAYFVAEITRMRREGIIPQCVVTEFHETRSTAQNSLLWACLTDVSEQVNWYGQKLTPDEWKDVLTASLKKQRAVPGIDGGFVILGARTSKMTVAEMSELMELIFAFGAERDVQFKQREAA